MIRVATNHPTPMTGALTAAFCGLCVAPRGGAGSNPLIWRDPFRPESGCYTEVLAIDPGVELFSVTRAGHDFRA
jgi:hypothetical protein